MAILDEILRPKPPDNWAKLAPLAVSHTHTPGKGRGGACLFNTTECVFGRDLRISLVTRLSANTIRVQRPLLASARPLHASVARSLKAITFFFLRCIY